MFCERRILKRAGRRGPFRCPAGYRRPLERVIRLFRARPPRRD
jgi:hypothetical protein